MFKTIICSECGTACPKLCFFGEQPVCLDCFSDAWRKIGYLTRGSSWTIPEEDLPPGVFREERRGKNETVIG